VIRRLAHILETCTTPSLQKWLETPLLGHLNDLKAENSTLVHLGIQALLPWLYLLI
jgi:hypothetical protein